MIGLVNRMKVYVAVSFIWRIKAVLLKSISQFQATEADGVWHLQRGIRLTSDPRLKAILFGHVLEEESHAETFVRLYETVGAATFLRSNYERKELYSATDPLWKLVAYVHVGEDDATRKFRLISDNLPAGLFKTSLDRITGDEEGHIGLTYALVQEMGGTGRDLKRELFRIRARRAWEQWLRVGQRMANWLAVVLLSALYFLIGPFLAYRAKAKLSSTYVTFDNNHLKGAIDGWSRLPVPRGSG